MSQHSSELVARLRTSLAQQRYSAMVIHNYCVNAESFLRHLARDHIPLQAVTPQFVMDYLREAMAEFRKRHGREPAPYWQSIPRAGIHAMLKLALPQWPPESAFSTAEIACRRLWAEFAEWQRTERNLAPKSILDFKSELHCFLRWRMARGAGDISALTIAEIDAYFSERAPKLRRRSIKDTAQRLRAFVRFLHATGRIPRDISTQIISPTMYAYESIPSALSREEIEAALTTTRKDRSALGLRDYAILMLLATYGVRAGEIMQLRLDDIDWRAETLRIRHTKTRGQTMLPLTAPVGEALLEYLDQARPKTDRREVFLRARAPYQPLRTLHSEVRRRLEAAGVKPEGKTGPHAFRHAHAVSMLRAAVPRKVIGDLLGHRCYDATTPYLKLATEDLRAIALDIPGLEVPA
ncbi:MAG: tyrosine-type recombinase/integrase [Hyphomonadaceae bacterium]|nr:tyrosine-type recombinase/integrase [Hyphomonadaceae bacterium]MBP9234703.1 tyrosine-type recombinase/integrase [Hyphomonadaceae bacterium]